MSKKYDCPRYVGVPLEQLAPIMSECLAKGQEVVLTITGNSMSPFLRDKKDQVVLVACDPAALQPGDVPLFRRRNGKYVLHRIVQRDDGVTCTRWGQNEALHSHGDGLRYTMLGDAQWQEEPDIAPDQIIAVATAFISRGKRWECDSDAYVRNRMRWHRLLPIRPVLVFVYHLPHRLRYGVPRRLRRWIGQLKKK
ncbi:MAG: S24/S26 family peptidase [Clostridia bacterium]|nr:S24/S26 family peptidase [Clostridia bacterium]